MEIEDYLDEILTKGSRSTARERSKSEFKAIDRLFLENFLDKK